MPADQNPPTTWHQEGQAAHLSDGTLPSRLCAPIRTAQISQPAAPPTTAATRTTVEASNSSETKATHLLRNPPQATKICCREQGARSVSYRIHTCSARKHTHWTCNISCKCREWRRTATSLKWTYSGEGPCFLTQIAHPIWRQVFSAHSLWIRIVSIKVCQVSWLLRATKISMGSLAKLTTTIKT